jgi:hypothetical protein
MKRLQKEAERIRTEEANRIRTEEAERYERRLQEETERIHTEEAERTRIFLQKIRELEEEKSQMKKAILVVSGLTGLATVALCWSIIAKKL